MSEYETNYDGFTAGEARDIALSGRQFDEVFACALDGIMAPPEEAYRWVEQVVVLNRMDGFCLRDWDFEVVGVEPNEHNLLHLHVKGYVDFE